MVISHDRFFLDRICTHLLIMEGNGRTRWFEGNFAAYEEAVMAENPERLAHRRASTTGWWRHWEGCDNRSRPPSRGDH